MLHTSAATVFVQDTVTSQIILITLLCLLFLSFKLFPPWQSEWFRYKSLLFKLLSSLLYPALLPRPWRTRPCLFCLWPSPVLPFCIQVAPATPPPLLLLEGEHIREPLLGDFGFHLPLSETLFSQWSTWFIPLEPWCPCLKAISTRKSTWWTFYS